MIRFLFQMWSPRTEKFQSLVQATGPFRGRAGLPLTPVLFQSLALTSLPAGGSRGAAVVSADVTDGLSCRLSWAATSPEQQTLIFVHLEQRSPTRLASGTSFVEDFFSTDGGVEV